MFANKPTTTSASVYRQSSVLRERNRFSTLSRSFRKAVGVNDSAQKCCRPEFNVKMLFNNSRLFPFYRPQYNPLLGGEDFSSSTFHVAKSEFSDQNPNFKAKVDPLTTRLVLSDNKIRSNIFAANKIASLVHLEKAEFIDNEFHLNIDQLLNELPSSLERLNISKGNKWLNDDACGNALTGFDRFSQLQELVIQNIQPFDLKQLLPGIANLTAVDLSYNECPQVLKIVLEQQQVMKWKSLRLAATGVTDQIFNQNITAFGHLPELEHLDVQENFVSIETLKTILEHVQLFPSLKTVSIPLSAEELQSALESMHRAQPAFRIQTALVINCAEHLNYVTCAAIDCQFDCSSFNSLQQCERLMALKIDFQDFSPSKLEKLRDLMARLTSLTSVHLDHLSQCNLNVACFIIQQCELQQLNLNFDALSSRKISKLAALLANQYSLQELSLRGSNQDAELVKHYFSQIVAQHKQRKLVKLNVQVPISTNEFTIFLKALEYLPRLEHVSLSFNELSAKEFSSRFSSLEHAAEFITIDLSKCNEIDNYENIVSICRQVFRFRTMMTIVFPGEKLRDIWSAVKPLLKDRRITLKRVEIGA